MPNSACANPLDPISLQNQLITARKEIHNLRQQLLSLNHIHKKECEAIYKKLEQWQCQNCKLNKETSSSAPSSPSRPVCDFETNYVGTISTHFPEKRGTPRQPGICNDMIAKLSLNNTVFTNPGHALEGLQEFSHMWILFHFHKNNSTHVRSKIAPPRLNGLRTGVFATRSPHRPCPIGLSLVKIDRIMENTIYFSGVDMLDQTPVLDIKPYIPQYDNPDLTDLYYPEESLIEIRNDFNDTVFELNELGHNLPETSSEAGTSSAENVGDNVEVRAVDGDGEDNERRDHVLGAVATNNNGSQVEESFYARSDSRIGEREAPDGEEEETPNAAQTTTSPPLINTPEGNIRVPSWIDQPPVPRLTVLFKDRALAQLNQLGTEGEEKKNTITNILREDPRSIYLRERWGSHCYVFRIAELYVSCKFNDTSQTVTVYQVFQNEAPPESDE